MKYKCEYLPGLYAKKCVFAVDFL